MLDEYQTGRIVGTFESFEKSVLIGMVNGILYGLSITPKKREL